MAELKKSKGGRPTKLTPETMQKLREAMERGTTIEMACAYAGIHVSTYHEWMGLADKRGGLYAELRTMAREALAKVTLSAMRQIDAAADAVKGEGGSVEPGDWKAAAWRVERAERVLRNMDERPSVVRDHAWRRAEWARYRFLGGPKVRALKVDFLAHMEEKMTVNASCKAARVHRWQYKEWMAEDGQFGMCVQEAALVAAYQVEDMLLRGATSLDKDGKVQTTACFGILNAKSLEYGVLKAQLYARNNAKLVEELSDILLAELPADTATKLRERFAGVLEKASGLPPGASLK